jgi:hypothetical protein
MPSAITLISSVTVGSGGTATIDFTSIPATYTDLLLKFSTRDTVSQNSANIKITFNSSSSGYSERLLLGTGTVTASNNQSTTFFNYMYGSAALDIASTFGNGEMYIPNYAGSNNKSTSVDTVSEDNNTLAYTALTAGLWSNSAAITSITIAAVTNFAQYSTAYLYGISNA